MTCVNFELPIALYVENDLTEEEALLVESHLSACDRCRELAADIRESQAALKALRSEFVDGSVLQQVHADTMQAISRKRRPLLWPRCAIAAALVLALAAGWIWRMRPVMRLELRPIAAAVPPPHLVAPAQERLRKRARRAPRPAPTFKSEPLVVKMITDDPQVVIYWLVDQNGG